jgi:hypothetical protein
VGGRDTSDADSAAAGTTLQTGRKTASGRVDMDWTGEIALKPIAQIAMDRGKSAGAVASVMPSQATPASAIAQDVSRNTHVELASEMVASDLDAIIGPGHPLFDDSGNHAEPEGEDADRFVGGGEALEAPLFAPAEDMLNDYVAAGDRGGANLPGFMWATGNHTTRWCRPGCRGRVGAVRAGHGHRPEGRRAPERAVRAGRRPCARRRRHPCDDGGSLRQCPDDGAVTAMRTSGWA